MNAPTVRTTVAASPAMLTALLALLTAVGPISTDMYLPAFPAMRLSLHALPGQTQLTLAAWFFGLAIGQLVHGHLADQYGRRMPLLFGTVLYSVASIGCALADSMPHLSWWRLWAAFGGAASLVIPRAVIVDVAHTGAAAARMVSRMVLVMGVVPALAPLFGGFVADYWNWRVIFWIAAVYGAACSVLIYLLLPETLHHRRSRRQRVSETAVRYLRVWNDRGFRTFVLQGAFATWSLFAFLGGAPGVFQLRHNLTPEQFGLVFVVNTVGYVAGTQANARLMRRRAPARVLTGGTTAMVAVTAAMFALGLTGLGGAWSLSAAMLLFMACLGFVLPGAALGSVLRQGRAAGSASALYGTGVFFIGSLAAGLVGWLGPTRPSVMTGLMLAGALLALMFDRQRAGMRRETSKKARGAAPGPAKGSGP